VYRQAAVRNLRASYYMALFLLLAIAACGEDRSAQRAEERARYETQDTRQEERTSSLESSWPMFMHDISYLGTSPDTTLRPPLALVWKFKTGGPVNSSPVVADGTVYVGSDDHRIYALQARKWGLKWTFEAADRIICAPTVYEDIVYFSARDNKVYALDAATGVEKWNFQADGWINSPVVAFRQRIYFGCYDNRIYVLNAATGKRESQRLSSIKIGKFKYICSQGEFYPMDARYRASRWRQKLPASESWPATANSVVYIGARDSRLRAFDYTTRSEIWQFETDGWVDSSPAIADGMLYVGSRDGYIYAFGNAADLTQQGADTGQDSSQFSVFGVVTHDGASVYDRLDDRAEIIAQLNEGRPLPITDQKLENWYGVMLPDGRSGWISALDFIAIRWSEGLQVNGPLVKSVKTVILPQKAEEPSWSPDGSTVAFFGNISAQSVYWKAKSIWLASSDGSNPMWVADGSFFNPRISWSANSRWLALESLAYTHREIWMVRSNGTGLQKVTEGEAPAICPRGDKVALIRRSKASTGIWIYRLDTGTEEKLAEIPIQGQESYAAYGYIAGLNLPVWSPGGSRLAVGLDGYHYLDNHSRIAMINVSGEITREMAARAERIRDIAWSPDNCHLAYVTQGHSARGATSYLDKQIHLTDLSRRSEERVFEHCEGIAWSPDGRYMAFIEENDCMGMRRKVWLLDVRNWQRIQLLASREKIHRVFWPTKSRMALLATSTPSKTAPRTRGWIVSIAPLPE
jgi:Tol biopolymer transport system component